MGRRSEPFLATIRDAFHTVVSRGFFFLSQLIFFIFIAFRGVGAGCVHGRVTGRGIGRPGSGDYERGHRGHTGKHGDPLRLGHGFGGRFVVDLLPPGQRSARAEAEGTSPVIRVEIGAAPLLTFKLKVAGPRETIRVSDAPRMVEMDPSALSALVDDRAIKDLPLTGRRFTDLSLLMPGVTQDPRGLTSGSNGDLSYGGTRGYNTSFLIDGGDNNNGFYAQASGRYRSPYKFSTEVVQEFRVTSSGYGSKLGRARGAVVNVVTKSGTNQ
ncbi:MAG TPA: hypothetical protein VIX14_06105 [Terriglobales bacterium]